MTPSYNITALLGKFVEWSARDVKDYPGLHDHTVITIIIGNDADGQATHTVNLFVPLGTRL